MTIAASVTINPIGHPAPVGPGGEADWAHPRLGETWHGTVTAIHRGTARVRWHSYTPRGGGTRKPMRHATSVPARQLTPGRRPAARAIRVMSRSAVKSFSEALHPRDRDGRFTATARGLPRATGRFTRGGHAWAYQPIPPGRTAAGVKNLASRGRPDGAGTPDDPIDVQGDLDKAARLLADGRHVRLNQPSEVATVVSRAGGSPPSTSAPARSATSTSGACRSPALTCSPASMSASPASACRS